jgi:hypothetical protein
MKNGHEAVDLQACPWPMTVQEDFKRQRGNACVGQTLVSENERTRIWHIRLGPGQRLSFHTHVLDYFWTCTSGGRTRSYVTDGSTFSITEHHLVTGSTKYTPYARGSFKIHDLENTGDTELGFTVVEFLDSANGPLPVPASVRMLPHEGVVAA